MTPFPLVQIKMLGHLDSGRGPWELGLDEEPDTNELVGSRRLTSTECEVAVLRAGETERTARALLLSQALMNRRGLLVVAAHD
jgi:hypothetical protein